MPIEIEAPDGTVVEFPDGTPDATITSAMRQAFGGPAPAAPAAPAKGKGPSAENATASDYAAGAFGGFNKGLGSILDLIRLPFDKSGITDAVTKAEHTVAEKLGLPKVTMPQIGGRQFMKDIGVAPEPPDTVAGRAMARVGEEFGAAALPSAGLMAGAAKAIAPAAARGVPSLMEGILTPIANSPGRALTGEAVATAGAGTAAAAAREIAPDSPGAEMIAQIAGGLAPTAASYISPTAWMARGANFARKTFSADAQKKAGERAVRNLVEGEMTPDALASLKEADRLATEIPGFQPSVAEATGAPSLLAQQKRLEQTASGPELNRIVKRRQNNERAVSDFAEDTAPRGANDPELVIDTARGRVENLRTRLDTADASVAARRDALADQSFPRTDRAEQGGVIREQLNAERATRRQAADELSAQLGLDNVDVTTDFNAAARRLVQQFEPRTRFDDARNTPRVLDEIRAIADSPEPVNLSFRDLKGLRDRLTDDLIDATGSANPSAKQVRQLTQLRGEVDGLIERVSAGSADPTLAERYAAFRRAYFTDYIQPFEQGAAFRVRSRDSRSFYKTTDERVADAFFKAGDTTAADQFNTIFANRPEARAALRATVLDNMRDAVVRDGVIDPARFTAWFQKHRSVLERFPEIVGELRTVAAADGAYAARQGQLAQRRQGIEDRLLTRTLDGYARGTKTAEGVVGDALKDPRRMEQLVGAVRRGNALGALQRNVWDQATRGDAADILGFVEKNAPALNKLFSADHLKNIQNIAAARSMIERVPHPSGAAYVPRPLEAVERAIGQQLPQLSSRIFAFKSGRTQKEYLIIDSFLRSLRGRAQISADDALRAALYDPEIARNMARSLEVGSISMVQAKRLQSRMIALGLPYLNEGSEAPDQGE